MIQKIIITFKYWLGVDDLEQLTFRYLFDFTLLTYIIIKKKLVQKFTQQTLYQYEDIIDI